MKRSRIALLAIALVCAVTVAACGSSNNNSASASAGGSASSGSSGGSGSGGSTATGSPLKVMVISASGDQVYSWPTVWTFAKDAADSINASGGINNHPIDVITCNDQADPSDSVACARQAVQDKVVALVGGLSLYPQPYAILKSAGIPWVGDLALNPQAYTSKLAWSFNPSPFQYLAAGLAAGKQCKKVGAARSGASTDQGLYDDFAVPGIKAAGKQFTKEVVIPVSLTDFSGPAAQVAASGDCFYLQLADQQSAEMMRALQANGTHVTAYSIDGTFSSEVANSAPNETNGAMIASVFPPVTTSKAWAPALAAINKYSGSGSVDTSNANVLGVWPAFQAFANVAKTIKGAITPSSLITALNHATHVSTGGVLPTMDLAKPFPDPAFARLFNSYVTFNTVQNGKIVAKSGFQNYGPTFLKATGK